MLADTETEVTGLGEILLSQLIFLDLEATLEDLLGLGATDGNVDGNLFVTTDTEGTDSVASLAYSLEKSCPISHAVPKSLTVLLAPSIPAPFFVVPTASEQRTLKSNSGVLTVDWSLTAQLLEHLSSTGKSVTRLADTDVEHELLDAQLAHGVCALVLSVRLHGDKLLEKKLFFLDCSGLL